MPHYESARCNWGGGVLGDMFSLVVQMIGEVWHALNLSGLDIT
jgi:hypothetical protein